jgi:mobilome CxxCx(11)CxxC protein
MLAHTSLFNKWKDLASDKSAQFADSFKSLKAAWEHQEQTDMRQSISDKEMRYAAREAYFYFKKPCHVCKNIPSSRKPTDCEGCGKF